MNPGEAIPARTLCLGCDYDLTGLTLGPCPECGQACGPLEIEVTQRRQVLLWRAKEVWSSALSLLGLLLLAECVGMAFFPPFPLPVAVAAIGGPVALGASALFGEVCFLWARSSARAVGRLLWVQCLWWLHVPWLCAPFVGFVAAGGSALLSRVTAGRIGMESSLTELAIAGSTLVTTGCLVGWRFSWRRRRRDYRVTDLRTRAAAAAAMLLTLTATGAFGLIASVFAAQVVDGTIGIGSWLRDWSLAPMAALISPGIGTVGLALMLPFPAYPSAQPSDTAFQGHSRWKPR